MVARGERSRRTALIIGVPAALLLIVVAWALGSSSPRVCALCHADHSAALATTSHREVTCYACHLPSGGWGWAQEKTVELTRMYPAALLHRVTSTDEPVRVSRYACLQCHQKVLAGVIEAKNLRISHVSCAADAKCDSCHGATAHGASTRHPRDPVMEECAACHVAKHASNACDTCHRGRSQHDRLAVAPWQVTHGANWPTTHGMGDLRYCVVCHPSDYCVHCHGLVIPHPVSFARTHGEASKTAACDSCHSRTRFCDVCHGIQMPHPAGFLQAHSKSATGGLQDPRCLTCHDATDCEACHVAHVHPAGPGIPSPGTLVGKSSTTTSSPVKKGGAGSTGTGSGGASASGRRTP